MTETQGFAFTEEYQAKLLSFMLHDHQFCAIAQETLKPEMYANKALQWYHNTLSNTTIFHTTTTLREELIRAAKAKHIKETDMQKYLSLFSTIKVPPVPSEQEHMRNSLGTFIRTQSVKAAVMESLSLIEAGEWDEIADRMAHACNTGYIATGTEQYYFNDTKNRILRRMNQEIGFRIPTGIPELDYYTNGGIHDSQLFMVAGGTGRGKSIFLQYLARTAILHGRKVIYYTLEMSAEDIAARCDSMFAQININEINVNNEDLFAKLSPMADKFGDSLIIQEYPADSITVTGIQAHLSQLAAVGWKPDLIIVDYLDLIKPHRNYGSTTEELDAITKALHGLAKHLKTRIWTASQLNRAGIVMENPDETAIAGALSKLFTVDFACFLAQTKEEHEDELMRILIVKNRNGPKNRKIEVTTDFGFMTFFRDMSVALGEDST